MLYESWVALHPEYSYLTINPIVANYGGGGYGADLEARIEQNNIPGIFWGFGGRLGELAKQFAIDHTPYLNPDDFYDYDMMIDKDGAIRLVRISGDYSYPVINADLFREAGVPVPEPWTIMTYEEYLAAAEGIKALDKDAWMFTWFTVNRSSQHWNWGPLANIGHPAFSTQDDFLGYNDEASVALLTEFKRLYDEGYLHPGGVGMKDDETLTAFGEGKIGLIYMRAQFMDGLWGAAIDSGAIKEPFEVVPLLGVEYQEGMPVLVGGGMGGNTCFVSTSVPEPYREAAVSLMLYAQSRPYEETVQPDTFINYKPYEEGKAIAPDPVPDHSAIKAYIFDGHFSNDGTCSPIYNRLRALWAEEMQAMFLGLKSPTEALATYTIIGKSWVE
jgi:ABC-type glycerol-3-phosphate transport system substrate-binding protein